MKSLDAKLRKINAGNYKPQDFIIADAKDGDMAMGPGGAGPGPDGTGFRVRPKFHDAIRDIVKKKAVDIMLGSASTIEALADARLFDKSPVTPAIRANDTTDIWLPRGAHYSKEPSRPFRTASLQHVKKFCNLGLYSVTFNNVLDRDYASIEAYARFREEAHRLKFRHFLEVFNPNAPQGLTAEAMPGFVNDSILRMLAGVTKAERPAFLKIVFNGKKALAELADHDPGLVVGVLGGSAGTTRDTFELLTQSEQAGARVALFGRKINLAESPLDLLALFRPVIERSIAPEEAVRAYHGELAKKHLAPKRPLADDLLITEQVLEGYRG
ncbi:hypothetical protein [Aestuariivirga sp.]|uniref:hypothetical protein n=1 Tax=Aestuariivirga sp. TaxID=2650926 RepID=UPI0039E5F962